MQATQGSKDFRHVRRIAHHLECILHSRTSYRKEKIMNIHFQHIPLSQMRTGIINHRMAAPETD